MQGKLQHTVQLWPSFGATIYIFAKPGRSFQPPCGRQVHSHVAHVRPSHGIHLLLVGLGPHVSPAHGTKPGAPLPHISGRWNPAHKHGISGGLVWIPRDHIEPLQHARATRAL